MGNRTQQLAISPSVKKTVYERDLGCCVLCGRQGLPEAHYIPRSQGGLGIEQNIVTLCRECHNRLDGIDRRTLLPLVAEYLNEKYPNYKDEDRRYKK